MVKPSTRRAIKARLKSETPSFFKKLGKLGLSLAAFGTIASTVLAALPITLPAAISYAMVALIVGGGTLRIFSRLPYQNEAEFQQNLKEITEKINLAKTITRK